MDKRPFFGIYIDPGIPIQRRQRLSIRMQQRLLAIGPTGLLMPHRKVVLLIRDLAPSFTTTSFAFGNYPEWSSSPGRIDFRNCGGTRLRISREETRPAVSPSVADGAHSAIQELPRRLIQVDCQPGLKVRHHVPAAGHANCHIGFATVVPVLVRGCLTGNPDRLGNPHLYRFRALNGVASSPSAVIGVQKSITRSS
jgi:hypothetical protein